MRISPVVNKKMTGEYWDFTTTIDQISGQVDTYFLVGTISFTATAGDKGNLYIYLDDQLKYNAQIRNVRDSKGNLLFGNEETGSIAYVGVGEPTMNVWGQRTGYRHDLKELFSQ